MITEVSTTLVIESPSFGHNEFIPLECTCDGININPSLIIKELPENTESLVLIVDDPDAEGGTYTHWLMWNIPPTNKIEEGDIPGTQGINSKKEYKYSGPCPPPDSVHHYHFKVYAMDTSFDLPQGIDKKFLLKAMEGHIIATGELIGLYKR